MTKHEYEAPDFARHAEHIEPKRTTRKPSVSLSLYWCGLIAVLVTLMIAHAVVRSGIAGGW